MDVSLQVRAEQLAAEFAGQARTVEGLNGFLRLMLKSGLERMHNTELDVHLGRRSLAAAAGVLPRAPEVGDLSDLPPVVADDASPRPAKKRPPNRRSGHFQKTVQGDMGGLTLSTPRSRRDV